VVFSEANNGHDPDMIKLMLSFLSLLVFLPGCGFSTKEQEPPQEIVSKRLAGRVQSVNRASQFVLIRRYGYWRVDEGDVVVTSGDGRTANLLPTGEKLGEHIAADIRSGDVQVGDAVYIRKMLTSKEAKPSEEVKKQAAIKN
jgi:hypothetical protein